MRCIGASICLLSLLYSAQGQIVSDGKAIGTSGGSMRSAIQLPTARLGAFDKDSALQAIQQQSEHSLRLLPFAHKQKVNIDIIKEGYHFTIGEKEVWQYRVTSAGAKNLNFFFGQFHLPQGALLYIMDSFSPQNNSIGGFGAKNNNSSGTLPTQLIHSADVIIEVQAPKGELPPPSALPR